MKRPFVLGLILFFLVGLFSFIKEKEPTPYQFPELPFFPKMPNATDNPLTVEGVELGRHLFYDSILSDDFSMSCASCHKQAHAFSDSPNALSIGKLKLKLSRNTLPLFNLAWYPGYFWDGRAKSIEEQVFHPLRQKNEMNLDWEIASTRLKKNKKYKIMFQRAFGKKEIDSVLISKSIGQFLRSLVSYQSKYDRVIAGKDYFTPDEYDGFVLVNDQTKGDCIHCHITDGDVLGTNLVFSNNGLDSITDPKDYPDKGYGFVTGNSKDYGKFKVPSLRNLAFTSPYMHDGRFKTLEEVLNFYSDGVKLSVNIDSKMGLVHHGGVKLTEDEKRKIVSFLLTLSDSVFISKPEYGNPLKSNSH